MTVNKLLVFSHRGNNEGYKENTLDAINSVILLPIDGIEVDIRLTKDGIPVVAHDSNLKRIAGLNILISTLTFSELKEISIYKKYKIPKLSEVLELINNKKILNIELKDIGSANIVGTILAKFIQDGLWTPDHLIVSSKIITELQDFNKLNLSISTGLISSPRVVNNIKIAKNNFQLIVINKHYLRKYHVQYAHKNNLKILVYSVNKIQQINRLTRIGVDGIFTDKPNV